METYTITIKELSKLDIEVEAESYEEAVKKVEDDYWKDPSQYCLDAYDTTFE